VNRHCFIYVYFRSIWVPWTEQSLFHTDRFFCFVWLAVTRYTLMARRPPHERQNMGKFMAVRVLCWDGEVAMKRVLEIRVLAEHEE